MFDKSNTSIFDFYVSLYSLKIKHKISDSATNDILKFIREILPDKNNCPKNLKKIEKSFFHKHAGMFYTVCNICEKHSNGILWGNTISSKKTFCQAIINQASPSNFCGGELIPFVTFDIESQLKKILTNEKIKMIKSNIVNAKKKTTSSMHGPMDRSVYQNFIKDYDKELAISIFANTDGAPVGHSKNYSMWQVLGSIVELDNNCREKFSNMIYLGIIYMLNFDSI